MKRFLFSCLLVNSFFSQAQIATTEKTTDYSKLSNWAAHPWKKDLSDSVPQPLLSSYQADSVVDIFFLHPTSYLDKEMPYGWNAPVTAVDVNETTDKGSILYQSSVFNAAGRVFAPRYKQAHISAYYPFASDTPQAIQAFEIAYADVKTAFQYYIDHYNQGRPFILASHSQGTTHAKRLVQEMIDTTALRRRMIAAYLVGIVVAENAFLNVPPCTKPTQTSCACSWRTFKRGYEPEYVKKEQFKAIVTNPLTWNAVDSIAGFRVNKGAVLWKFNKILPYTTDAEVHGNVLWADKPRFFGNIFYNTKNYHAGDYNLYYLSIRENVQQRISAFWK